MSEIVQEGKLETMRAQDKYTNARSMYHSPRRVVPSASIGINDVQNCGWEANDTNSFRIKQNLGDLNAFDRRGTPKEDPSFIVHCSSTLFRIFEFQEKVKTDF